MNVQYDSLILVIFTEEQLQKYKHKYHTSESLTIFDIANEMRSDAKDVINNFDFLEFAEMVLRQTDNTGGHPEKTELLRRF